jgi:hypothetical protein
VLAVEPDNAARYWYSSLEAGMEAFELGRRFFATLAEVLGGVADPSVGPKVPVLFAQHGIEPLAVHLFPVSVSHLGAPAPAVWESRRETVRELIGRAPDESVRRLGADYVKALDRYARQAGAAGAGFVEIQHTMLFATVGQRAES